MSPSEVKRLYLSDANAIDLFASETDEQPRPSREPLGRERPVVLIRREVPARERVEAPALERRSLARPLTLVTAFLAGTLAALLAAHLYDQWMAPVSSSPEPALVSQVIEPIRPPDVVADAPAAGPAPSDAVSPPFEEPSVESEPPVSTSPQSRTAANATPIVAVPPTLPPAASAASAAPTRAPAPSARTAPVPTAPTPIPAVPQTAAAPTTTGTGATTTAPATTAPPTAAVPTTTAPTTSAPTAARTMPAPVPSTSETPIPAPPATAPAPAPVSSPVAPPSAPAIPTPPAIALDTSRIQDTLTRYRRAFSDLDANAVAKVWPNVNQRSLSRAFDRLREQQVSFDDGCQIVIRDVRAEARCSGTTRYVPRIGSHSVRSDARHWRFSLTKDREDWVIESVDAR